jgi:hypothetical protein
MELKCINKSNPKIEGLAQIADYHESKPFLKNKYLEFYYDEYLQKYLEIDPDLPKNVPHGTSTCVKRAEPSERPSFQRN